MYFIFFVFRHFSTTYLTTMTPPKKLGAHDLFYAECREEFAGVIFFIIGGSGEKLHPSEHMPN